MNTKIMLLDIEADDLLYDASRIWCMVGHSLTDNIYHIYVDNSENLIYPKNSIIYTDINKYLQVLSEYTLVAHNGISYDFSLLKKLYNYYPSDYIDTYIESCLLYPDREGHSIKYYGELFNSPKGDHKDFSKLSQEMLDYCIRDVNILHRVYLYLEEEKEDWDWSLALKIEYGIATLMASQEQHGVLFDVPKAETLVLKLEEEIQNIEKRALQEIPLRAIMTGNEIQKPFKKDGTYTKQVEEWINSLADPSVV